jgi:SAM-dependent methyltransferase
VASEPATQRRGSSTRKAKQPNAANSQHAGIKASAPQTIEETTMSWYEHPEWYELGFIKGTRKEGRFLKEAFEKHVRFPVNRLLELGCGSGRLVREMARRGYDTTGLDLSQEALRYCRQELDTLGCDATLVQGDMADFHFEEPFDAAFNAINTFRHLETETAALKHLKCVAKHLKPGGIFVLSLHLLPHDGDLYGTERWSAKTPDLSIKYALTVVESDLKKRIERLKITMKVTQGDRLHMLTDEIRLRLYTVDQLQDLLAKVKSLKLVGVYDFWFDIKQRRKLTKNSCDTVLVLQKVG